MKHFTINQLIHSDTAKARNINNAPTAQARIALAALVDNVLDPLREVYGRPLRINSGYRCPALNKAVGGATVSQHTKGEAVDITAGSISANKKLFELVQSLDLPFDQLIDEKHFSWIHISHKKEGNRKQVLRL